MHLVSLVGNKSAYSKYENTIIMPTQKANYVLRRKLIVSYVESYRHLARTTDSRHTLEVSVPRRRPLSRHSYKSAPRFLAGQEHL